MIEWSFDEQLQVVLSDLPPDDSLVQEITPWGTASKRLLVGIALILFTLDLLCLNYILPAIGYCLLLLGFRTLRQENPWFRLGYWNAIAEVIRFSLRLVINSTIYCQQIYSLPLWGIVNYLNIAEVAIRVLCVWGGFRAVAKKAETKASGSTGLLIWLAVFFALAFLTEEVSWITAIAMLVAFGFILYNLYKLSLNVDYAGFGVRTAPVHISDRALAVLLAAVVMAGIIGGRAFFSQYPMDWTPQEAPTTETQQLRQDLLDLGFPENVLADLSDEDLLACQGAVLVHVQTDYDTMDGHDHRSLDPEQDYGGVLQATQVAVCLTEEMDRWLIFDHFQWTQEPDFRGTEFISLYPSYIKNSKGWTKSRDCTGRLLYDSGDTTYTAPYRTLSEETYSYTVPFFGFTQETTEIQATFSLPNDGINCRGYFCYGITEADPGYIICDIIQYTCLASSFQYPVETAKEDYFADYIGESAYETLGWMFDFRCSELDQSP